MYHSKFIINILLGSAATTASFTTDRAFLSRARLASWKQTSIHAFKPWPKPVVESQGDYRAESFLEEVIGGELYSNQPNLPRLPLPTLSGSAKKFLLTALPLAENEEEEKTLKEAVESFPEQAEELQRRLEHRREVEFGDSSWLQYWWNSIGYLAFREPVIINVSYLFADIHDDTTLPADKGKSLGVMRGAAAIVAAANFRKKVCSGELPPETMGKKKTPLCSAGYKYIFNTCRVPKEGKDIVKLYDPSLHTHCVVASRGQFFAIDIVDGKTGDPLPLEVIEGKLEKCVEMAKEQEPSPLLGWLTSSDRDSWAEARKQLVTLGGERMKKALEKLESGALLLCLDDEEPSTISESAEIFWHGGQNSGFNRWFDKTVQIMCTANGKLGMLLEHALADGMQTDRLFDEMKKTSYKDAEAMAPMKEVSDSGSVENIFAGCFPLANSEDEEIIAESVAKAESDFKKLTGDHEFRVLDFKQYGNEYLVQAGFQADSFIQMAIQLATYRLFGKQTATYESTQVRSFLHGRTETTRSVSPASAAFVKKMGPTANIGESDESVKDEKLSLLKEAISRQVRYIGGAAKGGGADRHFFGLSMLVKEDETAPDLFSHPLFIRSKYWRVSSSLLPNAPGFGQVVPDGVGIGYEINENGFKFHIAARKEHDWVNTLAYLLEEALLEMQLLDKSLQEDAVSEIKSLIENNLVAEKKNVQV